MFFLFLNKRMLAKMKVLMKLFERNIHDQLLHSSLKQPKQVIQICNYSKLM